MVLLKLNPKPTPKFETLNHTNKAEEEEEEEEEEERGYFLKSSTSS
jgi:hypothetical protein